MSAQFVTGSIQFGDEAPASARFAVQQEPGQPPSILVPLDRDPAAEVAVRFDWRDSYTEAALGDFGPVDVNGAPHRARTPGQPHNITQQLYTDGRTRYRHELRAGEQLAGDVANHGDGRQRAELIGQTDYPLHAHLWFSYAFRWTGSLPPTWVTQTQLRQDVERGEAAGKPPAFALRQQGGRLQLLTRSDTVALTQAAPPEVLRYEQPMFPEGEWHHIVGRVYFDPDGAGSASLWVDGVKVYASGPIPLGYNDARGPHFSFGQYRGGCDDTLVYEFANVEMGTASLADRVAAPLPLPPADALSVRPSPDSEAVARVESDVVLRYLSLLRETAGDDREWAARIDDQIEARRAALGTGDREGGR